MLALEIQFFFFPTFLPVISLLSQLMFSYFFSSLTFIVSRSSSTTLLFDKCRGQSGCINLDRFLTLVFILNSSKSLFTPRTSAFSISTSFPASSSPSLPRSWSACPASSSGSSPWSRGSCLSSATVDIQDRGLPGDHDTGVALVLQDKHDEKELNANDLLTNN